jgi:hypothetical protein
VVVVVPAWRATSAMVGSTMCKRWHMVSGLSMS